jgi:hypothetical protein
MHAERTWGGREGKPHGGDTKKSEREPHAAQGRARAGSVAPLRRGHERRGAREQGAGAGEKPQAAQGRAGAGEAEPLETRARAEQTRTHRQERGGATSRAGASKSERVGPLGRGHEPSKGERTREGRERGCAASRTGEGEGEVCRAARDAVTYSEKKEGESAAPLETRSRTARRKKERVQRR